MAPIALEITSWFKRARKNKSEEMQGAINDCLCWLSQNPHHPGLHSHRVLGTKNVWESYIDQANRITWEYGENSIILRNNCGHDTLNRP